MSSEWLSSRMLLIPVFINGVASMPVRVWFYAGFADLLLAMPKVNPIHPSIYQSVTPRGIQETNKRSIKRYRGVTDAKTEELLFNPDRCEMYSQPHQHCAFAYVKRPD